MASETVQLRTGAEGCIQTAARRQHKAMVDALLDGEREPSEEEALQVDLLADFLNGSDFAALRTSSAALAGTVEAEVTLSRDASSASAASPGFRIDVDEIPDEPGADPAP